MSSHQPNPYKTPAETLNPPNRQADPRDPRPASPMLEFTAIAGLIVLIMTGLLLGFRW